MFRVGIFLDFVRRSGTTRTMHPHGAYVRVCGGANEIESPPIGVKLNGSRRAHGADGWVNVDAVHEPIVLLPGESA